MAKKKFVFGNRPKRNAPEADAVVNGGSAKPAGNGNMARLTIDIDRDLHYQIRAKCLERRVKMADDIRRLLRDEYGGGASAPVAEA